MQKSESITNIVKAICEFQMKVENPKKNGTNAGFNSKYPTLDEILRVVRPVLAECGIFLQQEPVYDDNGNPGAITMLFHTSGEYMISNPVYIPLDKKNAHGIGKALTYAKRYSLSAMLGISAEEDDDGNSISETQEQKPQNKPQKHVQQQRPQPQKQAPVPQQPTAAQTELFKKEFPASKSQISAICAIASRKGMTEQQRDDFIYRLTGKESKKDLSMDEASKVIEALQAMKGGAA